MFTPYLPEIFSLQLDIRFGHVPRITKRVQEPPLRYMKGAQSHDLIGSLGPLEGPKSHGPKKLALYASSSQQGR